jgi:hypothetical protein
VELPGIEPVAEIALTCGYAESEVRKYAKRRETTCGYAADVDGINARMNRPRMSAESAKSAGRGH